MRQQPASMNPFEKSRRKVNNSHNSDHSNMIRTCLYAKKPRTSGGSVGNNKNLRISRETANGGFGSKAVSTTKNGVRGHAPTESISNAVDTNDSAFAIFPALPDDVLATLVPASTSASNGGSGMKSEIQQRLDEIYGFPRFNYESVVCSVQKENDTPSNSFSLHDLISTSSVSLLDGLIPLDKAKISSFSTSTTASSTTAAPHASELAAALNRLPAYSSVRVLHVDPLVLMIDHFFTPQECEDYIQMSLTERSSPKLDTAANDGDGQGGVFHGGSGATTTTVNTSNNNNNNNNKNLRHNRDVMKSRSPTVGKDAYAKAQRTSTTWYHYYHNVPEFMAKACRLLGLETAEQWEEPQTVRYRRQEQFTWHLDALGLAELTSSTRRGRGSGAAAGQRIATLLVYLTELGPNDGGATVFRDLGGRSRHSQNDNEETPISSLPLYVRPRLGSALLFFPAAGGIPNQPYDIRTLHCGQQVSADAVTDKWIAQCWLRAKPYVPTAPPGNRQHDAISAMVNYCRNQQ